MRRIRITALLAIAVLAGSSCVKEKLEETYNRQEDQIDRYITSEQGKDESYTVSYNKGSSRLTTLAGSGPELEADGYVSFYYAGYIFNGSISASNLFGTNHQATAENAKWNLTEPDYSLMEIKMKNTDLVEGVRNGLLGVRAGEECTILFSGKYGFGNSTFGIIPANSALAYKIWVVGVSND